MSEPNNTCEIVSTIIATIGLFATVFGIVAIDKIIIITGVLLMQLGVLLALLNRN